MTITLYLQKETLLRDLATLQHIFKKNIEVIDSLIKHYEPLNISTCNKGGNSVSIQVSPEEFALIGVFDKFI